MVILTQAKADSPLSAFQWGRDESIMGHMAINASGILDVSLCVTDQMEMSQPLA